MFDELARLVGALPPGPLQFIGGCVAIVIGVRLAMKGQSDVKTAPTPPQEVTKEMDIPDWFARKVDDVYTDLQRVKWVVEDIRNKLEKD